MIKLERNDGRPTQRSQKQLLHTCIEFGPPSSTNSELLASLGLEFGSSSSLLDSRTLLAIIPSQKEECLKKADNYCRILIIRPKSTGLSERRSFLSVKC